ncbi:hypothetical protein TNCV_2200651 [Trichonephila clavipes]|nr:hypothetical protein TNCV_2200651 [Trichonephila clavipes]
MEAKHVNEFRHDDVLWEKISKGLSKTPDQPLKNTDKRMVYIYNDMFFVKKDFTFGFRTSQVSNQFQFVKRGFEPYDQMLYHRMVLEPHTAYPIPAKIETVRSKGLQAFPPTPAHAPAETNKRPLEEQPGPSSKWNRVFITPFIRPPVAPVLITRPSMGLATLQPVSISEPPVLTTPQILLPDPPRPPQPTTPLVQIPDPPVQIPVFQPPVQISRVPTTPPVQLLLPDPPPVQILLPDPLPVVETLERTLMDDSSMDQIMASVFGNYSLQGIPPSHTQEPPGA